MIRVLVLVACGPLLLPSGLCVCTAGGSGRTASHRQSVAAAANARTPAPTSRHCCHRHDTPKVAPDRPPHGEPTTPDPAPHDDHAPGCPAATAGGDRLRWVEPTAGTAPVSVQVAFVGYALVPATGWCRPPDPHLANRPCSPPLYLTHCSLVI